MSHVELNENIDDDGVDDDEDDVDDDEIQFRNEESLIDDQVTEVIYSFMIGFNILLLQAL